MQAQDLESIRDEIQGLGGKVVCVSHEHFGTGSDVDRSFEAGKYFLGPMYVDPTKAAYTALFSRKGLFNGFFGLADMNKETYQKSKDRKVTGNFAGDGFQLGGVFVVDTDGTVALDQRQKNYGDDPDNATILAALKSCKGLKP